jgi:septal ring factor EnvC (AmiA/AmiB activator)
MEWISVDFGAVRGNGRARSSDGRRSPSAVAKAGGASQPVLYVEFRKDGVPVDPGPWWAVNEGQKVRG